MQALHFLFSPFGRLAPQPFVVAAIVVYVSGAAAQGLTVPDVIARAGLWPFATAQAVLIWIWYALHARRLHDAGSTQVLAAGTAVLYALAVVLLLIVATAFFTTAPTAIHGNANATGALGLILVLIVIETLAGASSYDIGWAVVAILVVLALLPVLLAVGVTLLAATRPRLPEPESARAK
jgi:uncharacterized membrane protein YhaH (DUF805 family)